MAILERPRPNPEEHKVTDGTWAGKTFFFIPDCPSFGFWEDRVEANSARPIWLKDFRSASQADWQKYCNSNGYGRVVFR